MSIPPPFTPDATPSAGDFVTDAAEASFAETVAAQGMAAAQEAHGQDHAVPSLPAPGAKVGDRMVRNSGTFPFSGEPFRVFRHNGHAESAAEVNAIAYARSVRGKTAEPTQSEQTYGLFAVVTQVFRDGEWKGLNFADVMDLDSDDLAALVSAFRPPPGNV